MVLDRTDFGILRLLQNDASLSNKEIAAAIGLAPSSAHERLKRLRELRGSHADVADPCLFSNQARLCAVDRHPPGEQTDASINRMAACSAYRRSLV
jgi:hypothetical protein